MNCPMTADKSAIRQALAQQLESDRLLGAGEVPFVLPDSGTPRGDPKQNQERAKALAVLEAEHVIECRKCGLCQTRNNTAFGSGSPSSRLMFVGEAPGFEEDRQGLVFVGRAGELLTRLDGKVRLLNRQTAIMGHQQGWTCTSGAAREDFGFSPHMNLRDGVERTFAWYKENGWL